MTDRGSSLPDTPLSITNSLMIVMDALTAISAALFNKGEEDVGMEVDDARATLEMARKYCKDKRL